MNGEGLRHYLDRRLGGKRPAVSDVFLVLRKLRHMDVYSTWSLNIIQQVEKIVEQEKVDLIYSTSPPHSVHLLAKHLKKRTSVPWVMELRDSLTDWPLRKRGIVNSIQRAIESWYEPRLYNAADGIIFVTHYQKKHALQRCPGLAQRSSMVILNGYDDTEVSSTQLAFNPEVYTVVYTGSLFDFEIGEICKGFKLYEMRREKDQHKLELVIVGPVGEHARSDLDKLSKVVKVNMIGVVSHEKALEYQQSAHCLLLVQTADFRGKGSEILTGKVFEYIGARRPILAAVTQGELSELILRNNLGVVSDPFDPASVCEALSNCIELSKKFSEKSEISPDYNEKFTRRYQVAKTAEFIRSLV